MSKIYMFRHGQSTFNTKGIIQGHTDGSLLTDLGRQQAVEAGKKLADKNISLIISSPLKRAKETAELVNTSVKAEICTDNCFIEVNVGEAEGITYLEAIKRYGEFYRNWRSNDEKFLDIAIKGGETKRQVRQRIFEGLKKYADTNKNIAVAGHGIILSQTLAGLGHDAREVDNCAILCLDFDGQNFTVDGFVE